ncbi:MAG: hypothetical protein COW18_08575 [Zetaproteobacteria bacterium CG12_big_fil_rev_8_21_14_0_65_54_13]|nr:MAG: hypothetical protein COX55_08650 [Zetaproteobacteria bacterium CG23_combo_of_CG06-09_8_20_14_all_54_7]PIW47735.1 MAG: hypothetical protein COW18_08575 [Zetaproteobacteria bacterium CG12_big_fil_rev_8_21_14_0_65_54_13]PIX55927.1 MAG: hypothetical protein COZ50_00210 [Zetaproteobacteria bacterium CG_4_10_14_3_um_filter_54_28]PJA30403.1 MAG: hypothetical protein CO188_03705 [Zetaproteobacteria bacterium CG_4_9_14_3_um_filter_54_145]
MDNKTTTWIALLGALLIWSTPLAAAESDVDTLRSSIAAFKHSDSSNYAPKTIDRAEAYLGAAMLAHQQQKAEDEAAALEQARASLAEARQTAGGFRQRFKPLLEMRQAAISITKIITSSGQRDESIPQLMDQANKAVQIAITSHEQGDLNRTQTQVDSAKADYIRVLNQSMPWLADMADSEVGKAANAGASQFAPQIYGAAKARAASLRAYLDGIDRTAPTHPEEALYLAQEAKHMAQQVKVWRKKTGSHEEIVLKEREFNLRLATLLDMDTDSGNPMLSRIQPEKILAAATSMKQTLEEERKSHKATLLQLKQQYETDLAARLSEQSSELTQAQQSQMSGIKEAFQAKLERETYEQKRQQRLRALFKPDQVEILVNVDGSLLLRLSALKFASGNSKINSKYYDMLGQLKEAIAIYPERVIRIEGHTDNQGDVKGNQRLSLKRAESVRDFLISAGADASSLKALGYGEVRPVASNEFDRGREMNRRIDVVIEAAPAK